MTIPLCMEVGPSRTSSNPKVINFTDPFVNFFESRWLLGYYLASGIFPSTPVRRY